jgi:hypothetical protein
MQNLGIKESRLEEKRVSCSFEIQALTRLQVILVLNT